MGGCFGVLCLMLLLLCLVNVSQSGYLVFFKNVIVNNAVEPAYKESDHDQQYVPHVCHPHTHTRTV